MALVYPREAQSSRLTVLHGWIHTTAPLVSGVALQFLFQGKLRTRPSTHPVLWLQCKLIPRSWLWMGGSQRILHCMTRTGGLQGASQMHVHRGPRGS